MKLSTKVLKIGFAHGMFKIARATMTERENVIITVEHEGATGIGEATPSPYFYGEDTEVVLKTVEAAGQIIGDNPFVLEDITKELARRFPKAPATVCGIDIALHDLVGKLLGVPLWKMFGLDASKAPVTSFTIGIEEPKVMAERARAVTDFKVLKIKIGTDRDEEIMKAIRDVTDIPIRVDANTGWTKEEAVENINNLEKYDIEFVEQPIEAGDNEGLRFVKERVSLPIMADESSVNMDSLPGLVDCVDMINIKLMKCAGLREAMRMIHFADAYCIPVMLGCMSETSVSITAAAHLSPMVKYADLDGNYLIADDPYEGVGIRDGQLALSGKPGLGVSER